MCNSIPASQYQCKSAQNLLRLLFYFNFILKLIFSVICIFCLWIWNLKLCVLRELWFFFWNFSKGETAFLFGPAREAPFVLSLFCSSTKKLVHLCVSQHPCEKVYPCGRSSCWQWWKDLNKSSVFCASD